MPAVDRYASVTEVAERAGLSTRTVERAIGAGELLAIVGGGGLSGALVEWAAVDQWLAKRASALGRLGRPRKAGQVELAPEWTAALEDWQTWLLASGKPPGTTIVAYRSNLMLLARAHPAGYRLTRMQLAAWLSSNGWAPATMRQKRATIRVFYGWLFDEGLIDADPAARLAPIKAHEKEPRPAPEWVFQELTPADDRVRLMVDLGARQGLRRAEIAAVHTRDLRREEHGWSLIIHGKGAKERTVPLFPDVAERIRQQPAGWLFPSPHTPGHHLTASHVGLLVKAALPQGWTTHSLRRRFATQVYAGSHDLRSVQRLLGHSSPAITQRYVAVSDDDVRQALTHAAIA